MAAPDRSAGKNVADAEALWRELHSELLAYVSRRVPTTDVAADLVQSAFLEAHRELSSGAIVENPRAWLYRILKNLIVDAHRYANRRRALGERLSAELDGQRQANEAEARDLEEQTFSLLARSLPLFLRRLEPIYREALELTELEGLGHAEAAARTGVSLSGMKSRVQRARRRVFESMLRCCELERDGRGRVIACRPRSGGECC